MVQIFTIQLFTYLLTYLHFITYIHLFSLRHLHRDWNETDVYAVPLAKTALKETQRHDCTVSIYLEARFKNFIPIKHVRFSNVP